MNSTFDKTGTVNLTIPKVNDIILSWGMDSSKVISAIHDSGVQVPNFTYKKNKKKEK
jgi:hypothetical protein